MHHCCNTCTCVTVTKKIISQLGGPSVTVGPGAAAPPAPPVVTPLVMVMSYNNYIIIL